MFSGGIPSWLAAKRVVEEHGTENLTLLFCDTLSEDPDLYRFLEEAAADVGGRLVRASDGRDIWQVFRDERFLGNSRVAPCSAILKREIADAWIVTNLQPETSVLYYGHEWTEENRVRREQERRKPWRVEAPLCAPPYFSKADMIGLCWQAGIRPPRLYLLGFAHNNCGGGCVKAGIGHFTHLLRSLPEVFAKWESEEIALREFLGRDDIAILKDRRGGVTKPLTLTALRERVRAGESIDLFEIGGCGCFTDGD